MNRFFFPICAMAAALATAGSALATPITTANLSVASGSINFQNFTCNVTGSGDNHGSCATINVSSLTPSPAGIQFSTNLSVLGDSSVDAAITFNLSSSSAISGVGLTFNSNFFGRDVNSVTENVYASQGGALVGTATVRCGVGSGCDATTTDNIALNGSYTNLYITKDINLSAYKNDASGTVSIVQQTFSATPEPVSCSLIGGGLALIGLIRVRRNKA